MVLAPKKKEDVETRKQALRNKLVTALMDKHAFKSAATLSIIGSLIAC